MLSALLYFHFYDTVGRRKKSRCRQTIDKFGVNLVYLVMNLVYLVMNLVYMVMNLVYLVMNFVYFIMNLVYLVMI